MSSERPLENRLKGRRVRQGWSQAQLARQAGVSRAAVSAIEIGRLAPSVAAALALAGALDCTVEDLFGLATPRANEPGWAWPPARQPCRFWFARAGGVDRYYPCETTAVGVIPHDGVGDIGGPRGHGQPAPYETLVMACCDPAAALFSFAFTQTSGMRLLVLQRSSRCAMDLLSRGLVDVAGVHLARTGDSRGNIDAVRAALGAGFTLIRTARWQEGLALSFGTTKSSVHSAVAAKLRWVGREPGSGARQCLEELLPDRRLPRMLARDHRGVAEAIRCGWADAGVCHRLASEEAGLHFIHLRNEAYDLVTRTDMIRDPRIVALVSVIRSGQFRRMLGQLPGFDSSPAGELVEVK